MINLCFKFTLFNIFLLIIAILLLSFVHWLIYALIIDLLMQTKLICKYIIFCNFIVVLMEVTFKVFLIYIFLPMSLQYFLFVKIRYFFLFHILQSHYNFLKFFIVYLILIFIGLKCIAYPNSFQLFFFLWFKNSWLPQTVILITSLLIIRNNLIVNCVIVTVVFHIFICSLSKSFVLVNWIRPTVQN